MSAIETRTWRGCLAALGSALPWALGAAVGVAGGAYLTAVGGAGAPGATALDAWADLVVLPAVAFAIVFVVHLLAQAVWSALRPLFGRRRGVPGGAAAPAPGAHDRPDGEHDRGQRDDPER